jgi:rubrerythrin
VKGTEIRSILRKTLESVENEPQEDRDDVEAIKIAVDFESKGVAFYEKLRKNADEPQEKEFYGMLASIEREHFLSLQDAFEYFQDPAGWYRTKEKPHVDGG